MANVISYKGQKYVRVDAFDTGKEIAKELQSVIKDIDGSLKYFKQLEAALKSEDVKKVRSLASKHYLTYIKNPSLYHAIYEFGL